MERDQRTKESDLEQVKNTAKAFLYLDIQLTPFSPEIVSHPFFTSAFTILNRPAGTSEATETREPQMLNILEDKVALQLVRELITEQIEAATSIVQIGTLITKPYKLAFLKHTEIYLSSADIGRYLASIWSLVENNNHDTNVNAREIIGYLKKADKNTLMTEEEQRLLSQLPNKVTIYRGVSGGYEDQEQGLSWTLSKKVANYFATRYRHKGQGEIYTATIQKKHILAYIRGRSEEEIIVDIKYLENIEPLEEDEEDN